jgi:hypothetical protein
VNPIRPKSGGRVVLDRVTLAADEVRFRATLHRPQASWHGEARVDLAGGKVELGPFVAEDTSEPPPAWLLSLAHAFLRAEWKARQRPDAEPWPPRFNRWREERA